MVEFKKTYLSFRFTKTLAIALIGYALVSSSHLAFAEDVVIIINGDRLSGDVEAMTKNALHLDTIYAGTLAIDWSQIRELILDESETMLLKDDRVVTVSKVHFEEEGITLNSPSSSGAMSVAAAEVAEISPENWRLGKGGKFTGMVNLAFQIESGNSKSEEIDFDYDLTYRRKDDRFHSAGDLEIDSNRDTHTKQDWSAATKYDRFVSEKLYYSFLLGFKQEKFSNLDLRTTVGPSIGYQFIESEERNLLAEIGMLRIEENSIQDDDQSYWGLGWRIEYNRMFWKDRVELYHRQLGSQSLTDEGELLWRAWTGFRFPIWDGLAISTENAIDYNGAPAAGAEKTDNTFRLKLGYKW